MAWSRADGMLQDLLEGPLLADCSRRLSLREGPEAEVRIKRSRRLDAVSQGVSVAAQTA